MGITSSFFFFDADLHDVLPVLISVMVGSAVWREILEGGGVLDAGSGFARKEAFHQLMVISGSGSFAPLDLSLDNSCVLLTMMMKTIVLVFALAASTHGFAPGLKQQRLAVTLSMSVFDNMFQKKPSSAKKTKKKSQNWIEEMISKPVHGHGTGEDDLKEMYDAQQQVLHDRHVLYGSKKQLQNKYQNADHDYLSEIKTIDDNPADLNKKEDDAMWVDESLNFQFPWQKKNLKP